MMQHLNPDEFIKRLLLHKVLMYSTLLSRWINVNKNNKQLNNRTDGMTKQAAALESTPMNDPSKPCSGCTAEQQQQPPINNGRSIYIG